MLSPSNIEDTSMATACQATRPGEATGGMVVGGTHASAAEGSITVGGTKSVASHPNSVVISAGGRKCASTTSEGVSVCAEGGMYVNGKNVENSLSALLVRLTHAKGRKTAAEARVALLAGRLTGIARQHEALEAELKSAMAYITINKVVGEG